MTKLSVNGEQYLFDVEPDTPLLWVLRETLLLTGTKYGCGVGICGSCNVLIGKKVVQSCSIAVALVDGQEITTIEGLASDKENPVVRAWLEEDVAQCGYCQPGQIISATALLAEKPKPSDLDIDHAMSNNICRCGTYNRIRRAIHKAAIIKQGSM